MDYIVQVENIYKFLALSIDSKNMEVFLNLKKDFNYDLNLLGCFFKDFLTIENFGKVSSDENIYHDFVVFFEKNIQNLDDILIKLKNCSKIYLSLVFEEAQNETILGYIQTINACFAIDVYPFVIETINKYNNQKMDFNKLIMMLKLLTDIVINREEKTELYDINLFEYLNTERLAS